MKRNVFDHNKEGFPFIAYMPENVNKKLPVIVQLHGAGERGEGGEDIDKVDIHGFSRFFASKERECILILPQCPTSSFWVAELQKLNIFIRGLNKSFDIDLSRIYLTGLSMGGFGTWYLSLAYPEIFAAIAPVCGGGMTWSAEVLDMPVWAFHGSEDEVVLPQESMNMIHALRKTSKQEVKLTIFDGVNHNSWEGAYTVELYQWLLSQKRENI